MARAKKAEAPEENPKVNRREFLNIAWLASLGFVTVDFLGVTYLFAFPRFKEGEFGGVFRVSQGELPEVGEDPVANAKGKFWLTRTDEGLRAIYKVCTHLGCLYNWQAQENKFICPCHGSQFTYESVFIQGPAPRSLDLFNVKIVELGNDSILIDETIAQADGGANQPVPVPDQPAQYLVDTGNVIKGKPHG